MNAEIITYLRTHPDATCADIAFAIKQSAAYVSTALRLLKADGKIVRSKGNTKGTRYRVALAKKAGAR